MTVELQERLRKNLEALAAQEGTGAAWTVIDTWLPTVVDELVVHLGRVPVQRKRLRSLQLAVQRIGNVKAPRLRARDRKAP